MKNVIFTIVSMVMIFGFLLPALAIANVAPPEIVSICENEAIENGSSESDMADYVNPCLEEHGFSPLAKLESIKDEAEAVKEATEEASENQ